MLNRICAHAAIIACALGACALNVLLLYWVASRAPVRAVVTDWQTMLYVLIAWIPGTLLGSLCGTMFLGQLVRIVCSKINGAPLGLGDQVMVLSGPHRGIIAEVYEITIGQGGWELSRLDLRIEHKDRFNNIFEEYSLFKIAQREQDGAANLISNPQNLRPAINLAGHVVTEDGTPLPDAVVLARIYDGMGPHHRGGYARTAADGSYVIRGVANGDSLDIRVLLHESGRLTHFSERRHVLLDHEEVQTDTPTTLAGTPAHACSGGTVWIADHVAVRGVTVRGRALDPDTGRPIAGGEVGAVGGELTTVDSGGNYCLTVPPGELHIRYLGGNRRYPKSKQEEHVHTMVPEHGLSEVNIYVKRR
jgi:hypothetical protein